MMHPRALNVLNECLEHRDARVRLKAAEMVQDRVEGKPNQAIEVNATGALSIKVIDPYGSPAPPAAPANEPAKPEGEG